MQLVIFDGDDTLWSTEQLYDDARQAVRRIVEGRGLDGGLWEATERQRDVVNVATYGMSSIRFPTSCVEALDAIGGCDRSLRTVVWEVADRVFSAPAPLLSGAREVLLAVRATCSVVLLTKGDTKVQEGRIESSGLRPLFDQIEVVHEKTSSTFSSVVSLWGVRPAASVSVGNSLRSDILPAIEAGMQAIWIDAHVWEWERLHNDSVHLPERVVVGDALTDVPTLLKETLSWV